MFPSSVVQGIVKDAQRKRMQGVRMVMERVGEFSSPLQAQLTGIALDPVARDFANARIDRTFDANRNVLQLRTEVPELVIGSGFHAATYAATRALMGKPAPYVFERTTFAGGAFAYRADDGTYPALFNLNSRNRRGSPGLSGDYEAQLNYLPGAPIQASALSSAEYQSNADIAFVTRLTLAQYAPGNVFPAIEVVRVEPSFNFGFDVTYVRNGTERRITAGRVIDARGLGDPVALTSSDLPSSPAQRSAGSANGTTILTFPQFLQRMSQPWPLRGLRNVAVIGGGDSGKCVVESLLGLGPNAFMAAAELDTVNRVEWYGSNLQPQYLDYCRANRGRYRAIGRYLRPDRMGNQRLNVFNQTRARTIRPVALPDGPVLVNGRSYDLVIVATSNQVPSVPGLNYPYTERVYAGDGLRTVACRNDSDSTTDGRGRYRIGPRADIGFDDDEERSGVANIDQNRVAMFRLGTRTAALAVQLP